MIHRSIRLARIVVLVPAVVMTAGACFATRNDVRTNDVGLDIHSVEIATAGLVVGATIVFTWLDIATNKWTGQDCTVTVAPPFVTP